VTAHRPLGPTGRRDRARAHDLALVVPSHRRAEVVRYRDRGLPGPPALQRLPLIETVAFCSASFSGLRRCYRLLLPATRRISWF